MNDRSGDRRSGRDPGASRGPDDRDDELTDVAADPVQQAHAVSDTGPAEEHHQAGAGEVQRHLRAGNVADDGVDEWCGPRRHLELAGRAGGGRDETTGISSENCREILRTGRLGGRLDCGRRLVHRGEALAAGRRRRCRPSRSSPRPGCLPCRPAQRCGWRSAPSPAAPGPAARRAPEILPQRATDDGDGDVVDRGPGTAALIALAVASSNQHASMTRCVVTTPLNRVLGAGDTAPKSKFWRCALLAHPPGGAGHRRGGQASHAHRPHRGVHGHPRQQLKRGRQPLGLPLSGSCGVEARRVQGH